MSTFEKKIVVYTLVIGFIGAVILVFLGLPSIFPSVFLATGIATLIYNFLGGISDARFDMGPIKFGGSIAALIASSWFINTQLPNPSEKLYINENNEVHNSKGWVLGELSLSEGSLTLGEGRVLLFKDSIELGFVEMGDLQLTIQGGVMSNDIEIGHISSVQFMQHGFFNDLEVVSYSEVKYDLRMSPFGSRINEVFWNPPNRSLRNSYYDLPFEVKPVYKNDSDRSMLVSGDVTSYFELEKGADAMYVPAGDDRDLLFYIRVRSLVRNLDVKSYDNSVVYQIFCIKRKVSE